MAKTAVAAPAFPKFDLNAYIGLHKANLETALQAQKILADTAQAVARLQVEWLKEVAQRAQGFAAVDPTKKPEAVLADVRADAERAFAVARQGFDLGVEAQNKVVDLFAKRAAANFGEVKAFAAAA